MIVCTCVSRAAGGREGGWGTVGGDMIRDCFNFSLYIHFAYIHIHL